MLIDFVEVPSILPIQKKKRSALHRFSWRPQPHVINHGINDESHCKLRVLTTIRYQGSRMQEVDERSLRNVFLFRLSQSLFKSRTVPGFFQHRPSHWLLVSSFYMSMGRPSTVLRSVLYSPALTTNILRISWILFVCWAEAGVYFWSLSICKWPTDEVCVLALKYHTSLYRRSWSQQTTEDASHVLLISDPQISVPSSKLFSLLHTLSTDKSLKKSWYVTRHLDPQVVFFLGDMLSDGKSVKNEAQWVSWLSRNSHSLWTNTQIQSTRSEIQVPISVWCLYCGILLAREQWCRVRFWICPCFFGGV